MEFHFIKRSLSRLFLKNVALDFIRRCTLSWIICKCYRNYCKKLNSHAIPLPLKGVKNFQKYYFLWTHFFKVFLDSDCRTLHERMYLQECVISAESWKGGGGKKLYRSFSGPPRMTRLIHLNIAYKWTLTDFEVCWYAIFFDLIAADPSFPLVPREFA